MIFKQLFDQTSGTYSYLLADENTREAVFIDTVYEQHERDLALVNELQLTLLACLETHCHADHVTGAWLLNNALGSALMASKASGIEKLDRVLSDEDVINFGNRYLTVKETPGHTDGCISFVLDNESMVFTGDCLLIRGCGRTDFQQGSAQKLFHSIHDKLFLLPDHCLVYPGHDYAGRTASSIGEEKTLNPRLGGLANEGDFIGYMENMQLPHPKQIDVAVPGNIKGGEPDAEHLPQKPDWALVVTTYSGSFEITPQWVAANMDNVNILDVRTAVETDEESTRLAGAILIPINELRDRLEELPKDKPLMTLCRSGKRSALAANILKQNGWDKVANIKGGLLQWQAEGLPTVN
jgi:sulfur dioxygenase